MRKKIALISEHASPLATLGGVDAGGQNVYVAELAKYLAQLGFIIDVFTRREDPDVADVVNWLPGVRVIHVKAGPVAVIPKEELLPHMTEFRKYMINFMDETGTHYDLAHANFWMSALVAMELKKIVGIPYVVTFHALGHIRRIYQKSEDKFPPERVMIEEEAARCADRVIAECPQDRDDLINYYNVDPAKITIIPCGFCPDEFYPVNRSFARSLLGLDQKEHIILQLGRMVPRKGVDNVIRSLSRLKDNIRKIRLLIVGGESIHPDPEKCPEIKRLQAIAKEEGVEAMVSFTGRRGRDLLKYYYSAADVFVTTPWYEPFGITPLESMACGTPVIGADVGGIKYSVKNEQTGFLVPPNDPDALAARINELISDPLLIRKMKTNALQRVHTFFTWARVAELVCDLYYSICSPSMFSVNTIRPFVQKQLSPIKEITDRKSSGGRVANLFNRPSNS